MDFKGKKFSFVLEESGKIRAFTIACMTYTDYCEYLMKSFKDDKLRKEQQDTVSI